MTPTGRARIALGLSGAPASVKLAILLACDAATVVVALLASIWVRYDDFDAGIGAHWSTFLLAPAILLGTFASLGLYRIVVRYAGASTAPRLAAASAVAALVLAGASFIVDREGSQSRSVFVNFGVFAFLGTWGWRLAAGRFLRTTDPTVESVRVAIYGAGVAGAGLASALRADPTWKAVAFLDDNPRLHGKKVADLPVRSTAELDALVADQGVEAVFLALPSVAPSQRRAILARMRPLGIRVLTIPTLDELVAGRADFRDLRQLDIEDLIGRRTVSAEEHLLHDAIGDRVVLVTGGGGSIGSELCRQILATGPRRLVVVDQSEFNLYRIGIELEQAAAEMEGDTAPVVRTVLGDVCDEPFIEELLASEAVEVVFHAAAYKHVPIVESNEPEGVRTNVLGTTTVLDAAIRRGIERFVMVSTDKAVRPTNVMGASKRLAELVVQGRAATLEASGQRGPVLCLVRFGNVLESSGSVVPRFRHQIETGGPVTVTHPQISRFFMTIPEAAELVLQAAAMATGGEVFLLDMGEPIRILDLARSMIELSGLSVRDEAHPDGDIEIEITGLRPGEKIHEELLIGADSEASAHPRIHRAREQRLGPEETEAMLEAVRRGVDLRDRGALRDLMERHAGLHVEASSTNTPTPAREPS